MAPTARRAAMAKTPTSAPARRGERGLALLEAAIALGLVSLIAATGYGVFSRAADATARAEARLAALTLAENALERASAPDFLARAAETGEATLEGDGWRVTALPHDAPPGRLTLLRLTAEAPPGDGALVTLTTLRGVAR